LILRASFQSIVKQRVEQGSLIFTDGFLASQGLENSYGRDTITHSAGNYVDGTIHTNTIEGYRSLLERGIFGIYHRVSTKHLDPAVQSLISDTTRARAAKSNVSMVR
jgi:hypothetical protein